MGFFLLTSENSVEAFVNYAWVGAEPGAAVFTFWLPLSFNIIRDD